MATGLIPEVQFARKLASNNKTQRDRAIKKLRKWMVSKSSSAHTFNENDLLKLWKGLYYCVWMSDKPLIQEELTETISDLIFCFDSYEAGLVFYKCFLKTMSREWFSIDKWRIDKFLMLVRRMFRKSLSYLKRFDWNDEVVLKFIKILSLDLLTNSNDLTVPASLKYHVIDMFCEELAKVGKETLSNHVIVQLLEPLMKLYCMENDKVILKVIEDRVFYYLMRQSDVGIRYEIERPIRKINTSTNNTQLYEIVEDETESGSEIEETPDGPLDPRAGRVNVELPQLKVNYNLLANRLKDISMSSQVNIKGRNRGLTLTGKFECLHKGKYPLALSLPTAGEELNIQDVENAAENLMEFEKDLLADNEGYKKVKRNKSILNEMKPPNTRFSKVESISKTKRTRGGRKLKLKRLKKRKT